MAVASAGPYANLHIAPDKQPRQHPTTRFLQAGCPSCRPTNSIKALKHTTPKSKKWNQGRTMPRSPHRAEHFCISVTFITMTVTMQVPLSRSSAALARSWSWSLCQPSTNIGQPQSAWSDLNSVMTGTMSNKAAHSADINSNSGDISSSSAQTSKR